jgi:hypothetical protein
VVGVEMGMMRMVMSGRVVVLRISMMVMMLGKREELGFVYSSEVFAKVVVERFLVFRMWKQTQK